MGNKADPKLFYVWLSKEHELFDVYDWCRTTFEDHTYTWVGRRFIFQTEKERNWFLLRWS